MVTVQEIKSVLSSNPGITSIKSEMNCVRINSMLKIDLVEDLNVYVEFVQGTVLSLDPNRPGRTAHAWLEIPAGEVEDSSERLIVDGAVDQFSKSNYDTSDDINSVVEIDTNLLVAQKNGKVAYAYNRQRNLN